MGESFSRSFMRAVSPREEKGRKGTREANGMKAIRTRAVHGEFQMEKKGIEDRAREAKKWTFEKEDDYTLDKGLLIATWRIQEWSKGSQSYRGISCQRGRWEPIVSSRKLSVKGTIERYKKASTDNSNTGSISEANSQYYQQEATKLRQQITNLQNSNRNLLGDALSTMSLRDLKQLETRLEKGINKIRSKKNELLHAEIDYMQKREMELQTDNVYLRNKISDNERSQQHQHMNILPSTSTEYEVMPPFDSRSFLQVNLLDPNDHYSHQQQTALQLG